MARGPRLPVGASGANSTMDYQELDRSFLAVSHPVRRAIVERLLDGPATVGRASGGLGVTKPAVTKHLKILEAAGVVTRTVRGRTHVLRLEPGSLRDAADWLSIAEGRPPSRRAPLVRAS